MQLYRVLAKQKRSRGVSKPTRGFWGHASLETFKVCSYIISSNFQHDSRGEAGGYGTKEGSTPCYNALARTLHCMFYGMLMS